MPNNVQIVPRQNWFKRWYSFNKQVIPLIFLGISMFFFTAFLDFDAVGTGIVLKSHIAAIKQFVDTPANNLSGFYLFLVYMIAIVNFFNSTMFSKKRAPFTLILITILTIVQGVAVYLYTSLFFHEQATRLDYVIDSVARFSYSIMITGSIFALIGTIFAWVYVDWKYVKEVE